MQRFPRMLLGKARPTRAAWRRLSKGVFGTRGWDTMSDVDFIDYDDHLSEILLDFDSGLPELEHPVWHLHWIAGHLMDNWRKVPRDVLDRTILTGCERYLWFAIGGATFDLGVNEWGSDFYRRRFTAYVSWLPEFYELEDKLCRQAPESVMPDFHGPPDRSSLLWGCIRVAAYRAFPGRTRALTPTEYADLSFNRLVTGLCDEGVLLDKGLSFEVSVRDV